MMDAFQRLRVMCQTLDSKRVVDCGEDKAKTGCHHRRLKAVVGGRASQRKKHFAVSLGSLSLVTLYSSFAVAPNPSARQTHHGSLKWSRNLQSSPGTLHYV